MIFASPPVRELRLQSRLPDLLRCGRSSPWAEERLQGAHLDAFLEGPCMLPDGSLLVTDIPFGRILRLAPDGDWSVAYDYDGWPNGMRLGRDGQLLIADHRVGLIRLELAGQARRVLMDQFEGQPLHGLNDLVLAPDGGVFTTDQGGSGLDAPYGRLLYRSAAGETSCLLGGLAGPNGLVASEDGRTIFLALTRANAIWRLPLVEGPRIQKAGLFLQLSGGIGPDGLAWCTRSKTLLVVHPGMGVWQFDASGRPLALHAAPGADYLTNLVEAQPASGRFLVTESLRAEVYALETGRSD